EERRLDGASGTPPACRQGRPSLGCPRRARVQDAARSRRLAPPVPLEVGCFHQETRHEVFGIWGLEPLPIPWCRLLPAFGFELGDGPGQCRPPPGGVLGGRHRSENRDLFLTTVR